MATPSTTTSQGTHGTSGHSPLPQDIGMVQTVMVNVFFVGEPNAERPEWVLVDAGLPFSAAKIIAAAQARFGDVPPKAIVLTHGHFDHVGALHTLLQTWDVPVYAHELELPYLTGRSSYPPPDPTVGGGMMAWSSPLYPRGPYDFGDRIQPLPADGSVPSLPGWRWVATPGHTPGHVSFFRDSDRTLIVGDAFVTQKQESLMGVLTQALVFKGPPAYFTQDWDSARDSVRTLAALEPHLALSGHGLPIANPRLTFELQALAHDFDEVDRPKTGRYVNEPAVADEGGTVSVPEKPTDLRPILIGATVLTVIGVTAFLLANRDQEEREDEPTIHDDLQRVRPGSSDGTWTTWVRELKELLG